MTMKKIVLYSFSIFALVVIAAYLYFANVNSYQRDGKLKMGALESDVTVHRDMHGVPYIFADSIADAIRAQGFVVAQDRVFQVEMYRAIIEGKLASVIGEAGLESDIKMRVLGIYRNAERHAQLLDDQSQDYLRWYAQGYNAFINDREHEYPLELSLLNITPSRLGVTDLLAIQHFAGFIQSRNYEDEILSLKLLNELGAELAKEISPLNINPDRRVPELPLSHNAKDQLSVGSSGGFKSIDSVNARVALPASGSNNWLGGKSKSVNGLPILVNDPHLDASILPGPWYPVGLFTDKVSAVGANLPGVPGLILGRNRHISFGVTNAYGDSQDLYIETLDDVTPSHYLNGDSSLPFDIENVEIMIKDGNASNKMRQKEITIRRTIRGPVISDHQVFGLDAKTPIVFRTAAAELTGKSIGFPGLLAAKSVHEADQAFAQIDILYFNYLVADSAGGIAHRATGLVPIRKNGAIAKTAAEQDDWEGYIPKDEMPGQINPSKDWLGTSNHDVIPDNYPYYYSTHFSPNYRYERVKEWFDEGQKKNSEAHQQMLKDVKNKHAERLTPIFLAAISGVGELRDFYKVLSEWDFRDDVDSIAATTFHLTHEYLIRLMYEDKMSAPVFEHLLKSRYYWMQRTDELIDVGNSSWFDIASTESKEAAKDLIVMAALKAKATLTKQLGSNTRHWTWGDYHKVSFVSPLRTKGFGSELLGGGTHRVSGSGETLNRGQYSLNEGPYKSQWFSSLRMVADMSDNQKIMASMSGGNSSRQFHPYFKSHLDSWLKEELVPWWLDRAKVLEHSKHELTLTPK